MRKEGRNRFFLVLVFVFGFFLRLYSLNSHPAGFSSKEALLGYRGKLLSSRWTDETGRKLPLIFTFFEGYELPLSSYSVALSVRILGMNKIAVRLPFALMGCISLMAFYGIVLFLFPFNKSIAFWSLFTVALNPWAVFLSRFASEWSFYFNIGLILLWGFLITNIFSKKLKLFFTAILIILMFLTSLSYLGSPGAKQDFLQNNFSYFYDKTLINGINTMRGENLVEGREFLGKLFYNKSFILLTAGKKFLEHFKPQFYFAKGDENSGHGLSNFGPILTIFLPFFLFGLWKFIHFPGCVLWKKMIYVIFIIGLLPSVFSAGKFDQEKLIFVFPVIAIVIGFGISNLSKKILSIFLLLFIFNFSVVLFDALEKEPLRAEKEWQASDEKLALELRKNYHYYDKIFISDKNSPNIAPQLLFWLDYGPLKFDYNRKLWISDFDNFKIGQINTWEIKKGEKIYMVVTPKDNNILDGIFHSDKSNIDEPCYVQKNSISDQRSQPVYLLVETVSEDCILYPKKN